MRRKKTDASILILALWTVCFLSALSVILGYEVRQKIRLAYRLDEKDRLGLIADAGVMQALSLIANAEDTAWHALSGDWSSNEPLFKDIALEGGMFRVGYDVADESGTVQVWYGLEDEERKVNLNTADQEVIERLFVALGIDDADAEGIAACVVDWRDQDSVITPPGLGAEDAYYRGQTEPYDAKDAVLNVPEELMLVKGVTPEIYAKVIPYVTVYGSGKINVNTASEPALAALGLSPGVRRDIIAYRAGRDAQPGTADDGIFDSSLTIVQKLEQSNALTQDEITELLNASAVQLGTASTAFAVTSRAYAPGGKVPGAEVRAVIDNEGNVLYWRES